MLTTEECQQILLAADFMDELMLLLRLLVIAQDQSNLLPVLEKVFLQQRNDLVPEHGLQLAEAIFIFQVFDAREVGMPHRVVAVVQGLDPLVEHDQ